MDKLQKLLQWHEDWSYQWIERLGITEYHAMWLSFAEGLVIGLLLAWIF